MKNFKLVKTTSGDVKMSGFIRDFAFFAPLCILSALGLMFLVYLMTGGISLATGPDTSGLEKIATAFPSILEGVVYVLGGIFCAYGGVQIGLATANDNDMEKAKGIKKLIGGALIIVIGILAFQAFDLGTYLKQAFNISSGT